VGAAFTEQEKEMIKEQLKQSAKECLSKYGIKKTTVDELSQMAGISKGAFYKFYESKELLFFEIFEDFHNDFFGLASSILRERTDLNERDRIEKAILESCLLIQKSTFMNNIENEMGYVLRKIPQDLLKNHYSSDNVVVQQIISASGITLSVSPKFVFTAVHTLQVLLTNKEGLDEEYFQEILKIFIKSLCAKMVEL